MWVLPTGCILSGSAWSCMSPPWAVAVSGAALLQPQVLHGLQCGHQHQCGHPCSFIIHGSKLQGKGCMVFSRGCKWVPFQLPGSPPLSRPSLTSVLIGLFLTLSPIIPLSDCPVFCCSLDKLFPKHPPMAAGLSCAVQWVVCSRLELVVSSTGQPQPLLIETNRQTPTASTWAPTVNTSDFQLSQSLKINPDHVFFKSSFTFSNKDDGKNSRFLI